MGSLSLRNVTVIAHNPLFQDLTIVIGERDRIGLVAGNGAGKSTLLRCLAGSIEPSRGEVVRSRGMRIALVAQDVPRALLDLSLHDAILDALEPAERALQEWRVHVVLDAFEAPADLRERPVRFLSGGWQRLALIARAWVAEPDALLLDEPTNHLDLEKVLLLERWMANVASIPVVIASHDRDFLDACTTKTLFLRPETSVMFAHPYRRARALLAGHDAALADRHEKDRRDIRRLRQNAGELRNVGVNSGSDLLLSKAKQLTKRAEALEEGLQALHKERPGEIRLAHRGSHARVLLTLEKIVVRKPGGERLFEVPKLEIAQRDRVVLLGRNGAGKSQLIRLLHGAMSGAGAEAGIRVGPSVASGYWDQDMSQLPDQATPLDFILSTFRLGDQKSLSLLAGAGFPVEKQRQPIARLSPGQKARLGLLALRLAAPNFYLMDEPTNHLDIPGREALESAILASEATGILVSHDRSFIEAVGTRFLLVEGGRVKEIETPGIFYAALRAGG